MRRSRSFAVITVAVGALLGALGVSSATAAPPMGTDASEVTHWNQVATSTLGALPGPDGGAPPAFSINMGMVQGAVYDAVNAIGPKRHRPYLLDRRTGARASVDAAVATAAYDVISELVATAPERVPFPGRAGLLSTLSSAYAASLASVDDDAFKKQGVAVGHAAAAAMLHDREGDGRFGPSAWVPNSAPGHWQPLLSPTGAPLLDPTPWAGNVRPFLIQSSSQFRSVPPPALESAQWATEFNEVKALGQGHRLDPHRPADVHRQVVAERTGVQLERGRPAAHHPHRPGRRRQRQAPGTAEHGRRGRVDQLLERQVPLRLLAAVERRSHERARTTTPRRWPTRPGRRSSRRRTRSGPRATTASTPRTPQCCGCSSATTPWVGPSRSRASS